MIDSLAWTKLRYHEQQNRLWRSNARFKAAFAGRGSGKSEVARRYIVRWLPVRKPWPDPIYLYALPTYNQAKRVAWHKLLKLIPKSWILKSSESSMTITTKFGSTLYVMGLDKPERAEGVQWDGAILDESCDMKPGVFGRSLLPAFSHRRAWCWRIGVPKRFGIGSEESRLFYESGLKGEFLEGTNDRIESFTWPSKDILSPEDLAFAALTLDAKDFNEQYNASWETVGGSIFHAFSERNIEEVTYDPGNRIHIGTDFNVNPMCWTIGHIKNKKVFVFDELFIRDCNTQKALDNLHSRYGEHKSGFTFYGDRSSRSRSTNANTTDYKIIRNDHRFEQKAIQINRNNPAVQDRFAACNAMFSNAVGKVRFFVDPSCKHLINDLKTHSYKEGTNDPLKRGDASHMSDALGYFIHKKFPIRIVTLDGHVPEVHLL